MKRSPPARPIDLAAVRQARAEIARLVREHPELRGEPGEENVRGWEATLAALERGEAESMNEETKQVAFRLPVSLLDRLDAYAERMREAAPGMNISRADAARVLLTKALDAQEASKTKPKK